ncbi:MAG: putative pre-16S rRNA nuclease [Alphaproteobacteria bacterium MarineAlpha4_Bin2]|nr:MAG: putative pre-16S rRNA nuclease [Alphaproteobacteria bacterium MarineAlpha4_Bin2]
MHAMAIVDITDLRAAVPPGKRLLGLDLGSKTIGLAICDAGFTVASPLTTLQRRKFTQDAIALESLIEEREIGGLVIGMPRNMDGSEGPRVQSTRQFAANLLVRTEIPIAFWDERLSTAAVERVLITEADLSRRKRAKVVDKMAASYILQGALDLIAAQNG